ncbi:hypothetical protein Avbf_14777 [Armadillidium vulgare]|nr:hypothetical protein Avbf_14777 [Armadillidium vulgare]
MQSWSNINFLGVTEAEVGSNKNIYNAVQYNFKMVGSGLVISFIDKTVWVKLSENVLNNQNFRVKLIGTADSLLVNKLSISSMTRVLSPVSLHSFFNNRKICIQEKDNGSLFRPLR